MSKRSRPPIPPVVDVTITRLNSSEKVTPLQAVRVVASQAWDTDTADRIRMCSVCDKWFWAHRKDAQQCGTARCKSTHATRLLRAREREAEAKTA